MKTMRAALALLVFLAITGFAMSFVLESSLKARSRVMQIVQPRSDLLKHGGQGFITKGEPEPMVLDDPAAFLSGFGENGALLVDSDYLQRKGVYPLTIRQVDTMAWMARAGTLLAAIACALGFAWLPRLGKR